MNLNFEGWSIEDHDSDANCSTLVQGEYDADGDEEDEDDNEEHGKDVLGGETINLGGDKHRDVSCDSFDHLPQFFGVL